MVQTNYLVLKDTKLPQDATSMHTNRHSQAVPLQIFGMRESVCSNEMSYFRRAYIDQMWEHLSSNAT